MAKTKAQTRSRPRTRPSARRPPRQSWARRNAVGLGLVAAVLIVAVAVAATRGGGGSTEIQTGGGFVGGDLHSLVADPTVPGRLFVGGHQAVSASTNSGRTWVRVDSLDNADAMGWSFTQDAIWVSGHPGINRSDDDGRSFRRTNEGLPDTDVHAFGAAGSSLYGASPAVGVFASTDGGKTWEVRSTQAGQSFFGRILVDPADDQRLLAADARAGPAESTDGGRSWRRLGGPAIAVWVSRSGDNIYASGGSGDAARSRDGGRTWSAVELPAGASLVEADPANPDVLYAAGLDGEEAQVWVSRDGGRRWARP